MLKLLRWTMDLIVQTRLLLWACVAANLAGAIYGVFIWYKPSIDAAPPWAWAFIPVCPLAALAGSVALVGLRLGRRWPTFNAMTAFACIMWGIWTLAFWTRQWTASGVVNPIEVGLFVTHIGLICEGLLFIPYSGGLSLARRLLVAGWFWVSFYIHYVLGFHPPLTSHVSEPYIFWLSTILIIPLSAALLLLPLGAPQPAARPQAA